MNAILTQSRLKKTLLGRVKKPQDMKEETWQKLDEKALMAIQLCLADEVLDEFFFEENNILTVGAILGSLSKEVVGKYIDSETVSFSSPHA